MTWQPAITQPDSALLLQPQAPRAAGQQAVAALLLQRAVAVEPLLHPLVPFPLQPSHCGCVAAVAGCQLQRA